MDFIYKAIEDYLLEILACAAFLSLFSFIIAIWNHFRTNKIIKKYKRLMRGMDNKNLEALFTSQFDNLEKVIARADGLEKSLSEIEGHLKDCIQHVGVVRYNPFEGTGSDLSYSIALLDDRKNGVVLTGLFGRSISTTYAKPILKGESKYPLSDEEKEAIERALNRKD